MAVEDRRSRITSRAERSLGPAAFGARFIDHGRAASIAGDLRRIGRNAVVRPRNAFQRKVLKRCSAMVWIGPICRTHACTAMRAEARTIVRDLETPRLESKT